MNFVAIVLERKVRINENIMVLFNQKEDKLNIIN